MAVEELRSLTRTRAYVRRGSARLRNQLRTLLNHRGLEVMAMEPYGGGGQQQLKPAIAQLAVYGQMAANQLNP